VYATNTTVDTVNVYYTVTSDTAHVACSSVMAQTDYLSCGFSNTLDMKGDTIDAMNDGTILAKLMVGHPTPVKLKPANYMTNLEYFYDSVSGTKYMRYSRTLAAPNVGDVAITGTSLPMVFAKGVIYKKHYWDGHAELPFTVAPSFTFTPLFSSDAAVTSAAPSSDNMATTSESQVKVQVKKASTSSAASSASICGFMFVPLFALLCLWL
jgi:hypothetical protein